jgi:hypothetical protein
MLFLLPFAVGLAALRDPSEFWASALFTLIIFVLLVAVLGTVARRGSSRVAFLGFTLFGGSYLIVAFGPWPWVNSDGLRPPPLVTRLLLDQLRERKLGPASNWEDRRDEVYPFTQPNHQLSFGPADLAVMPKRALGGWPSRYFVFDVSPYKQIAHSLLAFVVGALGAIAGRIIAPPEADSPRPRIASGATGDSYINEALQAP